MREIMDIPEFINTDFLRSVLKDGYKMTNFDIKDTRVEIATKPTDNYTSTIYRIFLNICDKKGNERNIQFIVKFLINSECGAMLVDYMNVVNKEVDMLQNIIPKLSNMVNGEKFAARFYHTISEPNTKIIVMEDLKELQYQMVDRREGLDYEHCSLIMKKLGKMHGASMILAKKDSSLMNKYNFAIFHGSLEKPGEIQTAFPFNFPTLCEIAKTWPGFEIIAEKLDRMKDNLWTKIYQHLSQIDDKYKVLTHGDFWINNVMYKYNKATGKPIDVLFVDLQQSWYKSPGIDLQYFLNSSPQPNLRETHRDDLLRIYYDSFAKTLIELHYQPIPTFLDLQEEMKKTEFYGLITALYILPLALMDVPDVQGNLNDLILSPDTTQHISQFLISTQRYQDAIKPILKRYDSLELFDIINNEENIKEN